ncbi:MAG: hypothetical protein KGH72_04040 [Candidatus Micrarchaeota archaeon]|nr:hypothetical protein [Candidatus Micrarchaeota archaeon]
MKGDLYFVEATPYQASTIRSIDKIFYYGDTKFQNVLIAHTPTLGTFLALDKQVQSSEADYFIYHEALVHPCMAALKNPKRALIIGGGEGSTAVELLKHKNVVIDWVEIDGEVVDLCKKFLPFALRHDDKRVNLMIDDGIKFIKKTKHKYDFIIGDVIEPYMNPIAETIYNEEFARLVNSKLTDQGMYITLAWGKENGKWTNTPRPSYLTKVFPIVRAINFYMPAFSLDFMLTIASKKIDPSKLDAGTIARAIAPIRKKMKFYNEKTHQELFGSQSYNKK